MESITILLLSYTMGEILEIIIMLLLSYFIVSYLFGLTWKDLLINKNSFRDLNSFLDYLWGIFFICSMMLLFWALLAVVWLGITNFFNYISS